MAGTVTITEERLSNVQRITFDWLSDGAGAVSGTGGRTTYYYSGAILGICTVPDGGGDAPDDNYNITLLDDNGVDVLNSGGLLRDTANTEWVVTSLGYVVGSRLTLTIDSAGAANAGTLYVYVGQQGSLSTVYTDLANALYASGGIAAFPAAAAPANDVSIAEVLHSVWAGLMGTAAGENGITTWPAAAAPANNVSLAEGLRYIVETQIGAVAGSTIATRLNNSGTLIASKEITYDGSASYTAFTVTGLVAVKVVGYVTTALTNHADTTSVGTATSAAGLIAATAGTAMQTVGQAWVDNAPSKFETFPDAWALIGNGEDIAIASTANIAGGVVTLYCWYIPISSGSLVVAA